MGPLFHKSGVVKRSYHTEVEYQEFRFLIVHTKISYNSMKVCEINKYMSRHNACHYFMT